MAAPTACLRRSFSNPSEISHDFSQGDPYRALGESISFGRYMSEPLAWEKWSAFTNNRYLEEAEKYSKPGSVAKMKAYFEAHYGRFGVRKQLEQEQSSHDVSKVNLEVTDSLSINLEFPRENTLDVDLRTGEAFSLNCSVAVESGVILDAQKCPVEVQVSPCQDEKEIMNGTGRSTSNGVHDESDINAQADQCQDVKASVRATESPVNDEVEGEHQVSVDVQAHRCQDASTNVRGSESSAKKNVEMEIDSVFTTEESEDTVKREAEKEISNQSNEQKLPEFSVKAQNSRLTKLQSSLSRLSSHVHTKREIICTPSKRIVPKVSSSLSRLSTPQCQKREGISTPSKNKVAKVSSSLTRLSTPQCHKREGISTPSKNKVAKVSSSMSRLSTPQCQKREGISTPSKNMVAKVSSSLARLVTPSRTKKEGSDVPNNRELDKEFIGKKKQVASSMYMSMDVNSSDINFVKKPSPASHKSGVGKLFTPLGKMIRESFVPPSTQNRASVNGVLRHPSATPLTESTRSRVALEKAFARNTTLEQKLKSPSVGNVKSSIPSPSTFAPFSFRTEERAAKRRELFQKRLEKDEENSQLADKDKAKMTPDSRKASQSMTTRSNASVCFKKEILGDNTKISKARSQPPKCQGRPTSELAQDKNSGPPQRSAAAKAALQNSKSLPTNFPLKKTRQENASPNII